MDWGIPSDIREPMLFNSINNQFYFSQLSISKLPKRLKSGVRLGVKPLWTEYFGELFLLTSIINLINNKFYNHNILNLVFMFELWLTVLL